MSERGRRAEIDQAGLERIVRLMLDEAQALGAHQAEAAASQELGLSATARLGDVENLEYTNDRGVGVTVYRESRKGSASTSDFSDAALRETVAKAISFANFTEADPCSGLADPERMAVTIPDLDLVHPWHIEAEDAIRLAIDCENAAMSSDKRIGNSEGATVSSSTGARAYGNSHGFLASYPRSSHSISCVVVGNDDDDMQRDYYYSTARDPAELEDVETIGKKAAGRTVARLGARKIKTTNAPVLFAADVARGFIGHAVAAAAGGAQYRRSSFLLDAAGETVFSDFVQIQERPHIRKALASTPFDAEGVATAERDLVVNGVLQGYILNSYSARRLGLETTGNAGGPHNLLVPGNVPDQQSILESMERGLLVHELIGQGVNSVTGDYSRGAVGFWIEDGAIGYPVHEVTIAGNLRELYRHIGAIGNDQDLRGAIRCGSVLVDEMAIAGS